MRILAAESVLTYARTAARVAGFSDLGTLEAGKRADLVVVSADPRRDPGARVVQTYLGGRLVHSRG